MEQLRSLRHLIIDMDGVLWRGKRPMEGLTDFFAFLRRYDIRFILATNNASRSRTDYVEQLARFGVTVRPEEVLPSCDATAIYLQQIASPEARVFVVGEKALREALTAAGFQVVEDEHADFVVVGLDWGLTYAQLARAARAIWNGARFVGTNPDPVWPGEDGLYPGNGATLAFLERATGVSPVVVGKPEPLMFQIAMQRMGATPETTAVIGDQIPTDIVGGKRAGMTTILVLSGATTREMLMRSLVQPDFVFADIRELRSAWEALLEGAAP
ncbi:HAD-IIA family hydrolase [Thermoflexus sp.]|uniref:HAD-IIA family hydrolase n=1 Tax=Thermoflexus sp. TaxID=1969742 RepID=UPI0025ED3C1A|nr:HAD-IIA family hydrolase [Thermoflexus sp.]MDW8180692.1 HAD-IIA family hydrolase [Anaerolineae bacterium]MCS6963470.1 HAD-IIA family hydrolase [Thermoflexus sp.]MCS7351238.1 HAD-IIA family hydrolase [Thermoflexus sp.]MCX7689736.1 HAD-IIA family hydrolase [Thermoflexus sp.]MDW8185462.1 HAD-IIA family hydrolase [Anaerolineae bacterium]